MTVVLGLSRRRPPVVPDRPRQRSSTSSYEAPAAATNPLQFGRAYWLPPFGRGNGLDALFWTVIAQLPEARTDAVLAALKERDIPAWVAATERGGGARLAAGPNDLWVASSELDTAHDVLMRVLAA